MSYIELHTEEDKPLKIYGRNYESCIKQLVQYFKDVKKLIKTHPIQIAPYMEKLLEKNHIDLDRI